MAGVMGGFSGTAFVLTGALFVLTLVRSSLTMRLCGYCAQGLHFRSPVRTGVGLPSLLIIFIFWAPAVGPPFIRCPQVSPVPED